MDATQMINDSFLDSDEDENEEENENKSRRPLAKLCILKNEHIPETELPLFLGENVLGRDHNTCTLPLPSPSISKQHATICISVYRRRGCSREEDIEALVWDLGSLNGTRKGRLKLTPNVRYALSDCDSLVVADIPCRYISCSADSVSSPDNMKTPVSRISRVNAKLPHPLKEKGSSSKKCANRATETRMPLPDLNDTGGTPVTTSCLSFEKTPTQPQGTLVPESDLDSDEEKGGAADRRHKVAVSESDSCKSTPTCSTFLSPSNKIVPESEDESPITPSICTKNRPHRHVSFSEEETNENVGRQQLKEKQALAISNGSEKEEGRDEERAALGGGESEESGHQVPVRQESNVSLKGEDELPVSTPAAFTDAIPMLDMDSDTDVEGEEKGEGCTVPVTLHTAQKADHPSNTAQFYMDSDTDVDAVDIRHQVLESVPSSENNKHFQAVSLSRPEDITMDSDTDDDDDALLGAAPKAGPVSFQSTHTSVSAPSIQTEHFHLDSDTDVDEEEEKECAALHTLSKLDETPSGQDISPGGPGSVPAAPPILHTDSETDDEAIPAPAVSEPSVGFAVTEPGSAADMPADLDILSDSDTDVEDDSPLVVPFTVTALSFVPSTASGAVQSDSDADTDVDESSVPPAGDRVDKAEPREDSETDVEEEVDFQATGEVPHLSLHRENTPGYLAPRLQNCSTPVQLSEGEVEHMETQAFLSPSSRPVRSAAAPTLRTQGLASCSDRQEDENLVVAETQSFVLQTRDCQGSPSEDPIMKPFQASGHESSGDEKSKQSSRGGSFRLGLSDSHLQDQTQALSMESTQAFVFAEADSSHAGRSASENSLNLEATQGYGEDEEPARCSVTPERKGQVDLALEATQAYISDPYGSSEDETDEEKQITANAETRPPDIPTSSTLAVAETQPVSAFEEEDSLDPKHPVSCEMQVDPRPQRGTEWPGEAVQPQEGPLSKALSVAETQPMCASEHEESDDEDSIPGPRKRKAKPLQLEEEKTQSFMSLELSAAETQPMVTGEDWGSDDEDSIPGPRKRKAKPLQIQDEESQTLTNSQLSAAETQPITTCEDEESDEGDSIPGPRKRTAKPLQIQDEETQTLTNSEASTFYIHPLETALLSQRGETGQAEAEAGTSGDSIRGTRGTRARLKEEEEMVTSAEPPKTQTGKNKAFPRTRKRRGKSQRDESEEEVEDVEQTRQARDEKSMRQQKNDVEEEDKLADVGLVKEDEGEGGDVTELGQQERKKMEDEREKKQQQSQQKRGERELKKEIKETEDRMQAENAERLRLERERAEKEIKERERKEQEEKERAERMQKDKEEQWEREKKEKEDKERLEREKAEREEKERLDREEKERIENERKEREEKEKLETERKALEEKLERERKEQEHQARLESEAKGLEGRDSSEKDKQEKAERDQQESQEESSNSKVPARGRRTARRTAALCTAEPEQDSTVSTQDDVPARRTRSRSNSSNSVSSEKSAASVNTQQSRGRGRGRGAKRTSEPPGAVVARSSNRRKTAAAESAEQDRNGVPQGVLSRSNSSNSLDSDISSCSLSSRGRGRGGRRRESGRKAAADSIPVVNSQNDHRSASKPRTRGRRSSKAEESSNVVPHVDSQQASTTRGRWQASLNSSEPAGDEEPSHQEEGNVGGRGQTAVTSETAESPGTPAVSNGGRKGRKRGLEANTEEDSSSSSKVPKGKEKSQAAGQAAKGQTKEEIPTPSNRRGRASVAQTKKNADETMEEEAAGRRGKSRPSAVRKKKSGEQEETGTSVDPDPNVVKSEPQTPTSVSRKRQAPVSSPPGAKTPRSSSASPAASVRSRSASQAYKVLFTGVVDEEGERVLARLGGSMAKGVADMNCLVTDKVRRTVKFLCAVAKGVPIVSPQWLEKSGKAGAFLSPTSFIVKDQEQEKKFNFCLQESLKVASSQPLLQGYEIHVTKSVKPEPVQMKDILTCSGASFLPKMPSSDKPHTIVISCEEDWPLCGLALSASVPVVTAEFILTGILQQKLDFQTHSLSAPASGLQPAGARGRGRKKT